MWGVLRRRQGLDYEPSSGQAAAPMLGADSTIGAAAPAPAAGLDPFVVNQRTVAMHSCRPYPQPSDPDADAVSAPHGDWCYSKMLRALRHDEVALRQKAFGFLLELFAQKQEHGVRAINEGAVPAFIRATADDDEDVRALACMALQMLAPLPAAQAEILAGHYVPTLLGRLQDTSPRVHAEALRLFHSLHAAANDHACTKALVRNGAIPRYVELAASPDDDVCAMAMAALAKVFDVKEAFIAALEAGAMPVLTAAVRDRTDPMVTVEAAECLGKLAFHSAGKRAAVDTHAVGPVLRLMQHEDPIVRAAASGTVVALTITEEGKRQALAEGAVGVLVETLAAEEERDVLMNLCKTLCNMAEHPTARAQLREVVPRLEEVASLAESDHETVASSARRAVAMIHWTPGDTY